MTRDIEEASELLDVTNETELDAFLSRLVVDVGRESGGRIPPDRARGLTAILKQAAEQTLPTLTTVFGTGIDLAPAGRSPVSTAARVYGLELEGLSAEDRDYEIARQFIRFAEAAARQAAHPPPALPASAAVNAAIEDAARDLAPGLLPPGPANPTVPRSGSWVRRGNTIVLTGLQPGPV
jgi:hypothetical protein